MYGAHAFQVSISSALKPVRVVDTQATLPSLSSSPHVSIFARTTKAHLLANQSWLWQLVVSPTDAVSLLLFRMVLLVSGLERVSLLA